MTTIRFLSILVIIPSTLLLFLLSYFHDAPNAPDVIITFMVMFILPVGVTLLLRAIPFISQWILNREYYDSMGWDIDTIAEYERDLKLHDEQVKEWANTK